MMRGGGVDRQYAMYLPPAVHKELKVYCAEQGITISEVVLCALAAGLAESIGPITKATYNARSGA